VTYEVAVGLAYVCTHLQSLQEILDDGTDAPTPLELLLAAVKADKEEAAKTFDDDPAQLAALLSRVDEAVKTAGLIEGVYGRGLGRSVEPSGLEPLEIVYRCPLHLCIGRSVSQVTGARPVCLISHGKRELLRDRLP
jgi:hypothetical protein